MTTQNRWWLGGVLGVGALLAGGLSLLPSPWSRLSLVALLLQVAAAGYILLRSRQPTPEGPSESMLESIASFDTTLRIGEATMPFLRQGLSRESAQKICEVIHRIAEVDAVAITDGEEILGFHGVGCRRHRQGGPILTGATREVLHSGHVKVVMQPTMLTCDEPGCPHPLKSAIIAPLRYKDRVVGTFKLYRTSSQPIPSYVARMAVGITQLLGIQMELAEAERQQQLVTKARLEALQAQIRPHFLFNVLNTIIMFSRTDVEKSRDLLITLASFFRRSLGYRGNFITLQDEIEYINTYLALEQARFGPRLNVRMKLDPRALGVTVPVLTLQPLVENAIVHGIAPKEGDGWVGISARRVGDEVRVVIADNGMGMDTDTVQKVFHDGFGKGLGLGLTNVNDRMVSLYGQRYRLRIRSIPGRGTAILVRIPLGAKLEGTPVAGQPLGTTA